MMRGHGLLRYSLLRPLHSPQRLAQTSNSLTAGEPRLPAPRASRGCWRTDSGLLLETVALHFGRAVHQGRDGYKEWPKGCFAVTAVQCRSAAALCLAGWRIFTQTNVLMATSGANNSCSISSLCS